MPPAIIAVAAGVAAAAAGGFTTAAIIGGVLTAVTGIASWALAPKPKAPAQQDFAQRITGSAITTSDAIAYWRVGYGTVRIGGARLYRGSSDNDNMFHEVVALLSHEVDSIGTVILGDKPVFADDLDGNGMPIRGRFQVNAGTHQYLRLRTKLGTADQTAFDELVAESASGEWTADHRARGHALLYARFRFSTEIYAGGPPNLSAIVRAKKVYDTRDGVTRWTPNAALCIRDYLRLARNEGGYGCAADEIGTEAEWSAAANICDEIVASPTTGDAAVSHTAVAVDATNDWIDLDGERLKFQTGDRVEVAATGSVPGGLSAATAYYVIVVHELGDEPGDSKFGADAYPRIKLATSLANARAGTAIDISDAGSGTITVLKTGEPRYEINGWFDLRQPPRKVLEELLTACGGRIPEGGGRKRLLGLAWEAPVLSLDESHLRRGSFKVATKRSFRDRFNAVKGTYVGPLNDWQASDYPAVTSATYQAQDGERIYGEYDQPYTSRPGQAQRLAKLELARNRFERTATLPFKLAAYDCLPGQVIAFSSDYWAWTEKPFELVERKPTVARDEQGVPYKGIDMVLNETHEDIYDWASSEEQADAPVIAPTLPDWANIPAPGTPAVSEYLYEGRDGSDVKAVARLEWAASPSALITGYETEFWPSTGSEDDAEAFATPTTAAVLLAERPDIEPGKYVFRVRGTTSLGAKTNWSTTAAIEIFGLTAAPAAIESLTLQKLGGQALLRWDLHTDADVRRGGWIEFRHCPDESGADESESTTIGDRVDGRSTVAAMPLKAGTYFARAVDKLGNVGPWESVSTDGALQLSYSTIGSIVEDPAFAGTHSGSVVVGGALKIDGATLMDAWGAIDDIADWDSEGGIAAEATYTFSAVIDLGSVQRGRLRSHLRALVDNTLDLVDDRESNIDDWEDFDGVAPGSADAWVEFRQTPDDPAGAPSWTDWQRVDVTEVNARAFQLRCQLRSYDPAYNILVTELRAYFEDPAI